MSELVDTLRERLAAAFVSKPDDTDTPEREIVRKSLAAVIGFLRDIGIELPLRAPLGDLYAALEDIGAGRSNALLERADMVPGTSKRKSGVSGHLITAVAAITILSKAGWKIGPALSKVARGFDLDPTELANFRKNLTARGRLSGAEAEREIHDGWLRDCESRTDMSAVAYVNRMIKTFRPYNSPRPPRRRTK